MARDVQGLRRQQSFAEFGMKLEAASGIEDIANEEVKDFIEPLIVHYPPMTNRVSECKNCYQKKVCSLAALAIEDSNPLALKRTNQ